MILTSITSKTKKKILLKFFVNSNVSSYLRMLESEFQESTSAIRSELNCFEDAKLLKSKLKGNKKIFFANTDHPNYNDLHSFLIKITGIDNLNKIVNDKIKGLKSAYLTGKMAKGLESNLFDLVLVGHQLEKTEINKLIENFEKDATRKIRYLIIKNHSESTELLNDKLNFKIWEC